MYSHRKIRQRKGSANLARVRLHTLAMAHEVQEYALRAQSEWETALRDQIANEIERRVYPVDPYEGRQEIYAYHEAARIVRGVDNG